MYKYLAVLFFFTLSFSALAQDAEVGKDYEITIESDGENQYIGKFGTAKIGNIIIQIPDAKKGEKYMVNITAIKNNQYTGNQQASCGFKQVGGDRAGNCNAAP